MTVRPSCFAAPAMADGPNHAIAVLGAVDLHEDTPATDRVVDIVEHVDGLADASEFHDGACRERTHQFRGLHGAQIEEAGDPPSLPA